MENQSINNLPTLLKGGVHHDQRGELIYNNDFDLTAARRFYTIRPAGEKLRGWQGHKSEQKWFSPMQGNMLVLVVAPDDWDRPSASLKPMEFILKEGTGDVLHVPAGYATAFKALSRDAAVLVFSDLSLEESAEGSYRFDESLWYYDSFM